MPDDTINMICDRLDRIENKIDQMSLHGCALGANHEDIEHRVRSIEADRNRALGIISFVSVLFGALGAGLFKVFGSK